MSETGMLPKNVVKLVKKLAKIQKKQVETLRDVGTGKLNPIEAQHEMEELTRKGNEAVHELLNTRFAALEIGVHFDEEDALADGIHLMGSFFLEKYAMERMVCEITGMEPDEDYHRAGTYMVMMAYSIGVDNDSEDDEAEEEEEYGEITEEEYMKTLDALREMMEKEADDEKGKEPEGKVVPLFGEKGKKKK